MIISIENQFFVFCGVDVLHRFYCTHNNYFCLKTRKQFGFLSYLKYLSLESAVFNPFLVSRDRLWLWLWNKMECVGQNDCTVRLRFPMFLISLTYDYDYIGEEFWLHIGWWFWLHWLRNLITLADESDYIGWWFLLHWLMNLITLADDSDYIG